MKDKISEARDIIAGIMDRYPHWPVGLCRVYRLLDQVLENDLADCGHCDHCGHSLRNCDVIQVNGGGQVEVCVYCEASPTTEETLLDEAGNSWAA
jgi:hypothetical protein